MPLSYCPLVYTHRLIMTNAYKSHTLIFFDQKEKKMTLHAYNHWVLKNMEH